MTKEKVIRLLHSIRNDFLHSLDDGEAENADEDFLYSVNSNKECIEALDMAIKALSK